MAKDDYFRILYAILKELYETKKDGEKINLQNISPRRFNINDSYWLDIIEESVEDGYIKNVIILNTKTGRAVSSLKDMSITSKGIDFLQNNSTMTRVAELLKNVKDIIPGI